MIHKQLSSPHPHPLRLEPQELPPQKKRSKMIQIQELFPNPHPQLLDLSFTHPQFVAFKSLIISLRVIFIYTSSYVRRLIHVNKKYKIKKARNIRKNIS